MTMLKSYRSTYEIPQFTKRISQKNDIEAIERHGEEPQIILCKNQETETYKINRFITQFEHSEFKSLGIICKTQKQADFLNTALKNEHNINLLNAASVAFGSGIVITTAHLAKGLEFDQVIVPFCTDKNYTTEPDKQMLYASSLYKSHAQIMHYLHRKYQSLNIFVK